MPGMPETLEKMQKSKDAKVSNERKRKETETSDNRLEGTEISSAKHFVGKDKQFTTMTQPKATNDAISTKTSNGISKTTVNTNQNERYERAKGKEAEPKGESGNDQYSENTKELSTPATDPAIVDAATESKNT